MKFRHLAVGFSIVLFSFGCGKKEPPVETKTSAAKVGAKATEPAGPQENDQAAEDDLTEEDDEEDMGDDEGEEEAE